MSDTFEARLLRFWKLLVPPQITSTLDFWSLTVKHNQTHGFFNHSLWGERINNLVTFECLEDSSTAPQRSLVDWLIRDRFLIAPLRKAPIENGPRWWSYNLTDQRFLSMWNVKLCHKTCQGMQFWCLSLGEIINFVLLSQSSSQWDSTWETILTQALLRSLILGNVLFEFHSFTFYKAGLWVYISTVVKTPPCLL